jgi:hypothetical protein
MLEPCDDDDKYLDCQAVCQIAKVLLELDSTPKPLTNLRREAIEFADTPLGATVDELLRVCPSFFEIAIANVQEAPIPPASR